MPDENMIGQLAPIIVSVLSLIGTLGVAFINSRNSGKIKENAEALEAKKRAEAAEKETVEAKKALEDEHRQQEMEAVNDRITKLNERLESLGKGIKLLNECVERMHVKMAGRTAELESRIAQVVELLSRYAQTYSTIVQYYEKTNKRFDRLADVENSNLRYTVASAEAIEALVKLISELHRHSGEDHAEMAKLAQIGDEITKVKHEFMQSMVDAGTRKTDIASEINQLNRLPKEPGVMPENTLDSAHFDELDAIMREITRGAEAIIEDLKRED